jgi:hypothetical protein
MLACPYGDRSDIPSKNALRMHISRVHNSKEKSIRAEPVKNQNNEHITHPFSDEWDCAVCLHRFSSLESAEEHYTKRHVQKLPYETAKQSQLEKSINIQDLLNEMANQRAAELAQAPRDGVVQQNLVVFEPAPIVEPREQAPIVESESREESEPKQERPNTELDSKPQSTAVYDFFKNLFKGKNNHQVSKEPIPETNQIFMASRGVDVDGLNVSISTQPYFCKIENRYLSWNEFLTCKTLGHEVIYVNE